MEHFIIHCRKRYVQAFLYEFGYQFAEMKRVCKNSLAWSKSQAAVRNACH